MNVTNRPNRAPIGLAIDPQHRPRGRRLPVTTSPAHPDEACFMTTDGAPRGTSRRHCRRRDAVPITSVVIDPPIRMIIISSDLGVLRSLDTGARGSGSGPLPNVNVISLDFTVTPSLLRAATYGRSAFELTAQARCSRSTDLGFGVVAVGTSETSLAVQRRLGGPDHERVWGRGKLEFLDLVRPGDAGDDPAGRSRRLHDRVRADERRQRLRDVPDQQQRPVRAGQDDSRQRHRRRGTSW